MLKIMYSQIIKLVPGLLCLSTFEIRIQQIIIRIKFAVNLACVSTTQFYVVGFKIKNSKQVVHSSAREKPIF
jgi:hypothetical protein